MNWQRVALAVVVLPLSGCGGGAASSDGTETEPEPAVLTMPSDWSFFPEAGVSGDLTVEAGCILVSDYLVIWPYGTTWDSSAETVTFTEGDVTSVGIGEHFSGGGGQLPDRVYNAELDSEDADSMNRCLADTDALGTLFAYPSA